MRESDTTIANGAVAPRWKADVSAMNGAYGYGQNNEDGKGGTRTLSRARGTMYDPDSTTSIVYKIPSQTDINIKLSPGVVENVPHDYFADRTGPHSMTPDMD